MSLDIIASVQVLRFVAVLLLASLMLVAQKEQPRIRQSVGADRVFNADCDVVSRAAHQYLSSRNIGIVPWSGQKREGLNERDYGFDLQAKAIRDPDGSPVAWNEIVERYTQIHQLKRTFDSERVRKRGKGAWETIEPWAVRGYLMLKARPNACSVHISLSYERRVTQFLVLIPTDLYTESLLSNDRLDRECVDGIAARLGLR